MSTLLTPSFPQVTTNHTRRTRPPLGRGGDAGRIRGEAKRNRGPPRVCYPGAVCAVRAGVVDGSPPPPKLLGNNLVSLQKGGGGNQHSQGLSSDPSVTASGLGEWQKQGQNSIEGESQSAYLQTRTPRRQGISVKEPLKLPG